MNTAALGFTFYLIRLSYLLLSRDIRLTLQIYKGRTLTKLIKVCRELISRHDKVVRPECLTTVQSAVLRILPSAVWYVHDAAHLVMLPLSRY